MLRSQPRSEHDLVIAANNSWVLAFDNLSNLNGELSDSICRLSTGGGFATRQLYSDFEETLFSVMRPVLLNGINDLISRSDLLDRSLMLNLPRIKKRFDEDSFWKKFETARPKILGALLTAVSVALANIETITQQIRKSEVELPRLADFALWVMSAEEALQIPRGEFLQRYRGNREAVHDLVLDLDPFAELLFKFMENKSHYQELPAELLNQLKQIASDEMRRSKDFPTNPRSLGMRLSRLAPNLRARGLDYNPPDRAKRSENRFLSLTRIA